MLLLATGRLVHIGSIEPPLVFIGDLCPAVDTPIAPDDSAAWRNIWLTGECLVEVGLPRAGRHRTGKELTERVRRQLTTLITEERLAPRERAAAGSTLSTIGDERDLEEMVTVPAGEFLMGSDEYDDEKPAHSVPVAAFRISKYPVTN